MDKVWVFVDKYKWTMSGYFLDKYKWTRSGYLWTSISGQGLGICQTWHSTKSRRPIMKTQPCRKLCSRFWQPSPFQWKSFTKVEILKEPFHLVPFGIFQTAAAVGILCLLDLSPILLILSLLILMAIRFLPAAVSFSLMTWDLADFGFFVYMFVSLLSVYLSFLSRSWVKWRLDSHFLC